MVFDLAGQVIKWIKLIATWPSPLLNLKMANSGGREEYQTFLRGGVGGGWQAWFSGYTIWNM